MLDFEYELVRSNRRTIGISVKLDGSIVVHAPMRTSKREIEDLLREKEDWIRNAREKALIGAEKASEAGKLSPEEIRELADRALQVIPERVKYYAPLIGVTYGNITIRNQKSKWGSCSSAGNLNFNCLLMLTPSEVVDSVVVHELCHRKEMNHSERFYAEVLRVFPEYRKWDGWLKEHGREILGRMIG